MSKINLSDGFYKVQTKPEDTIKLGVTFPYREPPLIGIPLTNPMGWTSIPPNFYACTKIIAEFANTSLEEGLLSNAWAPPIYAGDDLDTQSPADSTTPYHKPICYWNVYVDDFCGLVHESQWARRAIKRALLFQSLDKVFWPLDCGDTPFCQEPTSLKKMLNGDTTWTTKKVILGWLIDSTNKTIRVYNSWSTSSPSLKAPRNPPLYIHDTNNCDNTGMAQDLLEGATIHEPARQRLRLTTRLHEFLEDFKWLAKYIASRPTNMAELISDVFPITLGACNASSKGIKFLSCLGW
eukprot:jgi/Psemu1/52317/gm1.52317_g